MQRIELDNFRVFGSPAGFDLAPVTVLTGKNNSGKSSLIKAFLVLADYLEQDDQTVLRLDGRRASRHRISDWENLRSWSREFDPDLDDPRHGYLTLAYQAEQAAFSFQFDHSENDWDARLVKFVMTIPGIGELGLTRQDDADWSGSYQLAVSQHFIDYLAGTSPAQSAAPAFILVEIHPDEVVDSALSLGALIQAALVKYGEKTDDADEDEEDGAPEDGFAVLDEDDEINEEALDAARFSRRQAKEEKEKLKKQNEAERRKLVRFRQALEQQMRFDVAHLGANRMHQARLYLVGANNSEINSVAEAFQRLDTFGGIENDFLNYWLPRFEIGDTVRIDGIDNAAIRITIYKEGKRINLVDLGFGTGQILTILLQIAALIQQYFQRLAVGKPTEDIATLVLIEEPEANLHPQLQSLLTELLAEVAQRYGFQFIIETHSEYLIRNIQVLVKERQMLDLFKVYYFDVPSDANSQQRGHEMRLREDGVFMDEFGEGFLMNESATLTFKLF